MTEDHDDKLEEHSLKFLEMAFRTDNHGIIKHPDGYGKKTGECGDTIEMFLYINEGLIKEITFRAWGCMNTNACSNAIVTLAKGKPPEQAWEITPEIISEFLESLPPDHFHCAELAAGTFYLALIDYQKISRNPWKKSYRL